MPLSDYTPEVVDVAAVLRTRTAGEYGVEAGDFTAQTRPTAAQVTSIIGLAVGDVGIRVGADLPEVLWPTARSLAVLRAAMKVELTYFPEQVATGRSPYAQMKEQYDEGIAALVTAAAQQVGAGGEAGSIDDEPMPSYGFPANAGGMVGWGTAWGPSYV